MNKRGIILLIIILVVVNISTYCGYGRMDRAQRFKKEIELSRVDHIEILKTPVEGAAEYPWKKLTDVQASDFEQYWDKSDGSMANKFTPLFKLWIYYTDKTIRKFDITDQRMKENRYYYYNWKLTTDYFENVYQNATSK